MGRSEADVLDGTWSRAGLPTVPGIADRTSHRRRVSYLRTLGGISAEERRARAGIVADLRIIGGTVVLENGSSWKVTRGGINLLGWRQGQEREGGRTKTGCGDTITRKWNA